MKNAEGEVSCLALGTLGSWRRNDALTRLPYRLTIFLAGSHLGGQVSRRDGRWVAAGSSAGSGVPQGFHTPTVGATVVQTFLLPEGGSRTGIATRRPGLGLKCGRDTDHLVAVAESVQPPSLAAIKAEEFRCAIPRLAETFLRQTGIRPHPLQWSWHPSPREGQGAAVRPAGEYKKHGDSEASAAAE
jgi:hypothetical protein